MGTEEKDTIKQEEVDDDDEGPPPGFQTITSQTEEKILLIVKEEKHSDINETKIEDVDVDDDDDQDNEGPPPGWSSIPRTLHPIHPPDVEMSNKQEEVEDEEGPPPGWHLVPPASQAEAVPADTEVGSYQGRTKSTDEGFQPAQKSVPPSKLLLPTPPAPAASSTLEKGQMVCGSCRLLLSYPRGIKYVQCPSCQIVNLVLEDHQVGQVKCGGCAVLLMYPYGAPSVRCCSCHFVTEIGAHNRRPPLSVQQAQRRPPCVNHVH
ncbi:hypothetical protein ACH5RR_017906 [Cinchona calisaya]|uniref:Zinc finger LSD1-type domain-containing protein n=1 Tax=Cinchona calisaya TaxID=153742 RepID=A0ABD2ZMU5_9GENT